MSLTSRRNVAPLLALLLLVGSVVAQSSERSARSSTGDSNDDAIANAPGTPQVSGQKLLDVLDIVPVAPSKSFTAMPADSSAGGSLSAASTSDGPTFKGAATGSTCSRMTIRKELRDLSASERALFLSVFARMFQQVNGKPSIADRLSYIHIKNQATVHGFSNFLPWHRIFTRRMEMEMQKIDPRVALHYWDWTKEAGYPERSAIFTDTWFGPTRSGCVRARNFPNLRTLVPKPACVQRRFILGSSPGAFYGRFLVDEIRRQNTRYDDFRATFESGPHASPHNGIGGHFGTMGSPSEPMFWVHHSFIDKCWSDWQKAGSGRFDEYSGRNSDMSRALKTDKLVDLGASVGFVLDHRRNLCYDFASTAAPANMMWNKLPPPPTNGGINARDILLRAGVPANKIPPNPPPMLWRRGDDDKDDDYESGYEPTRDEDCLDRDASLEDSHYNDLSGYKPEDCDGHDDEDEQPMSEAPKPYIMHDISDEEAECAADEYDEPMRHPQPISEEYMRMNNICVETQRAREKVYCDMIDHVNVKIEEHRAARKAAEEPCDEEEKRPKYVEPAHEEKEPCDEEHGHNAAEYDE